MYKICVCEKCRGTFVVTNLIQNEKLCAKCLNPEEEKVTFDDSEDNGIFDYDYETESYKRSKKDLFIGDALSKKEFRNIAILFCELIEDKYIELVGLDIFEGKVVKLVDENGKKKGLHTYKKEIAKFKHGDVISVPVKFVDDCKCINMFRICGSYEEIKLIGKTDFIKLRAKYENIYQHDICWSFKEILTIDQYEEFYCLLHFSKTRIKKYNEKLQISFVSTKGGQRYYVDCLDKIRGTEDGNYLRGLCLLKAIKKENSNEYEYYMIKNMAKIFDDKQMKKREERWESTFSTNHMEENDLPF